MTVPLEYLRARIEETEGAAQDAVDIAARYGVDFEIQWQWVMLSKPQRFRDGWSSTFHPGSPAPGEVLADVAVKRVLLDQYVELDRFADENADADAARVCQILWPAIVAWAMQYRDRPDFDMVAWQKEVSA